MQNTKKIISLTIISIILLGNFSSSLALSKAERNDKNQEINKELKVKNKKFQSILEQYFIKIEEKFKNRYYNSFGTYLPNIKYNKIIEKELELIILKDTKDFDNSGFKIQNIPKADSMDLINILFNEYSISDQLLESSFKVNYNSNNNYDSFLRALDRVIKSFENRNGYYPSLEELKKENIFLNRKRQKVGDELDKIVYELKIKKTEIKNEMKIYTNILKIINNNNRYRDIEKKEFLEDLKNIKDGKMSIYEAKEMFKKYHNNYYTFSYKIKKYIKEKYLNQTYILKYKEEFYTLKEAKAEIKKVEKLDVEKKDYEKLIGKTELKNIPEIYKNIPSNSIFIHIKNPQFLFSFLDDKKNNSNSGLQIIKKLRDLVAEKMGVNNWEEIKKNLKNEFIIVLSDLDLVSPNFLIILDKKDKGILVPGEKAMVAKTVGEKIYVTSSKKILEKYLDLEEKNSIYHSSDFRYVWFKKQNIKKDIFFFAGDNFFEKITSLEYFLKIQRKINDYINLKNLQNYVFALQKINEEKINDFDELKKILKFKKNKLKNYEVKNSIVTSKKIGKINDIKNISEINYDLNKISILELSSYKENILGYKEIWQGVLDPIGVIFSETKTGFEIDFFMTPIPKIKEIDFLVNIISNFGKEDFEIIKNPKMKIGVFGGIFGFDSDKLKIFLDKEIARFIKNKDNEDFRNDKRNRYLRYFLKGYNEINKGFFGGNKIASKSILDYLDGEFLISFGGIDFSIFNSWNSEKLDLLLAVKFKSKIKAKEFVSIMRKKFAKDFSRNSRYGIGGKAKEFLVKPIGKEYNGNTIYSVPVPYIGTVYYSIIDSFVYISLNKKSLQDSIDFYEKPDKTKQKFIKNYLIGTKVLYSFFDGKKFESFLEKNLNGENLVDLFVFVKNELTPEILGEINPLELIIKKYYDDYEYAILTEKTIKEISEEIGFLKIYSKKGEVFLSINKDNLKINDIDIKAEIDELFEKIDKKFFTKSGENILLIFDENNFILKELISVNTFNLLLNKDFRKEITPENFAYSFGIGNDEIQLKMSSFGKVEEKEGVSEKIKNIFSDSKNGLDKTNNILYIIIGILGFIILAGIGFIFFRKK